MLVLKFCHYSYMIRLHAEPHSDVFATTHHNTTHFQACVKMLKTQKPQHFLYLYILSFGLAKWSMQWKVLAIQRQRHVKMFYRFGTYCEQKRISGKMMVQWLWTAAHLMFTYHAPCDNDNELQNSSWNHCVCALFTAASFQIECCDIVKPCNVSY